MMDGSMDGFGFFAVLVVLLLMALLALAVVATVWLIANLRRRDATPDGSPAQTPDRRTAQ